MAHVLKLVQGGSTLVDFQSVASYGLREFSESQIGMFAQFGTVTLTIDVMGASQTAALDNLTTLQRALTAAQRNYLLWQASTNYTPVYLQWEGSTVSSSIVQTECFGLSADSEGAIDKILSRPEVFLSGRIENITLALKVRPYWEETSAQTLVNGTSVSNAQPSSNSGSAGLRGDLPAPLKIKVETPTASQDTLIVSMRGAGTTTSYLGMLESRLYTTRGANVANLTDTDLFSAGGAPQGQRWSPATTNEQLLLRWNNTLTANNVGTFRVFVRCRDNNATANVKIRVRAGLTDGTNYSYGDYGDNPKFVNTVAGTTALSWVDCGVITVPHISTGGALATTRTIELRGQALAASSSFDVNYVMLLPCYEDAIGGGYCLATMPMLKDSSGSNVQAVAGTGAAPDLVIDANDRMPDAYLETSGVPVYVTGKIIGAPLFGIPNQQFVLFYITIDNSTGRHTYNANNTVTVTATPRFKLGRGT